MPNEIVKLIEIITSGSLWLYFTLMVLVFYLIMSLFTWSFIRPLKFLGIPSIFSGLIIIAMRFILGFISIAPFIDDIISSILSPLLTIGLVCIIMGIVMIILNIIINNILDKKKNKKEEVTTDDEFEKLEV